MPRPSAGRSFGRPTGAAPRARGAEQVAPRPTTNEQAEQSTNRDIQQREAHPTILATVSRGRRHEYWHPSGRRSEAPGSGLRCRSRSSRRATGSGYVHDNRPGCGASLIEGVQPAGRAHRRDRRGRRRDHEQPRELLRVPRSFHVGFAPAQRLPQATRRKLVWMRTSVVACQRGPAGSAGSYSDGAGPLACRW